MAENTKWANNRKYNAEHKQIDNTLYGKNRKYMQKQMLGIVVDVTC